MPREDAIPKDIRWSLLVGIRELSDSDWELVHYDPSGMHTSNLDKTRKGAKALQGCRLNGPEVQCRRSPRQTLEEDNPAHITLLIRSVLQGAIRNLEKKATP